MHDWFEGIIKFGLSNALYLYLYEPDKKKFTLDDLKKRISKFDYGEML